MPPCELQQRQQQQQQQLPTHSNTVQSQSVKPARSTQPTCSQSVNPSQSGQQTSPVAPVVESPSHQEASSQQATSQIKPAASGGGFQLDPTVSIQPSTQTPFNVVTSGESGPTTKQRQSNNGTAAGAVADRHCMGPPTIDGFAPQISPFLAQSERSLHIQHASQHPAPSACNAPLQKTQYNQGGSSRSGSYTYGSNHNPSATYPVHAGSNQAAQDLGNSAHCYPNPYMQSHLSSQGSAGFNALSQSMPQCQFQQQQVPQGMQSWQGCEVRASPRHPGGAWHWSDGIGQNMGQNHMDSVNHSGSNNWDSQQAQSSQFSMPSQPDWSEQQPWQQQQSDVSAAWAGPMRPPWPPQAIAVTPQGSAFGHTVGPLTEPHRLPGELEPPACRWMASANSALAEMFPGQ
ncbi:hypothetical protein ABBQ32_006338 [Trebouxia sp. C0010 RCD-2024]